MPELGNLGLEARGLKNMNLDDFVIRKLWVWREVPELGKLGLEARGPK